MPYEIETDTQERDIWTSLRRGFGQRCPSCGQGHLFGRYLKVEPACARCGTELHHQRADDAPPYMTMTIVGHVVVGGLLLVERRYHPDVWIHMVMWLPLTVGLSLWLLPRIKGALIGYQWALRMHGFGTPTAGIDFPERWAGDDVAAAQGADRAKP